MGTDFDDLRKKMVDWQLAPRGIKSPQVLEAMSKVPRHLFVPPELSMHAYADSPLPIGEGQTISQPYIVALMSDAAELDSNSRVLEIGTGSGYAAAVLASFVQEVYTVERIPELAEQAIERFENLRYKNIHVKIDDGTLGWPEKGPFDAIIVTAGAPIVPSSFIDQLKVNGRLIIPVGDAMSQQLVRLRKLPSGEYHKEFLEYVRFVPLIGKDGW